MSKIKSLFQAKNAHLYLVMVLSALILGYGVLFAPADPALGKQQMDLKTFEEQSGIRITLVGLTAAGGMVDFRYTVIDRDKAEIFLAHEENMPMLAIGDTGTILMSQGHSMRSPELVNGRMYFMFYPNAGNIVRTGTPVSVIFGSLILEPVNAQ